MSHAMGADGFDDPYDDGWDIVEDFRYRTSLPLGRWLINRRRRAEGKRAFAFFRRDGPYVRGS